MSVFEAIMLLCFGSAWPFSIYTSYKSRTAKGKSLFFLVVVFIGYIAGILHKVMYSFDYVIILYIFNFCMIGIDMLLYFRNKKLDRIQQQYK
ncbi:hypothetical protein LPY66_11930 [Dehalobacter sp. DCM]|uniref:hypothetical protein n=1 Tax=Dehalobacter sp. DCM TaxID=2907827 RepID=UPI0030818AEF|nr:hypothetical protein LPY66_11930 [Dehalobacter sp. DCM]